ncbi:MAG TPA: transcriptional regulator [Opitutae bacterium]|nr:transcriptional regulator [Puniceicoccaceae bacterium]HBR94781.1 transcriptional regulator [Opitutae bacterium]|tara:strand:+ start:1949 stop:2710 length:762 start_codon:yes stop_codon:yes gene_type:complete
MENKNTIPAVDKSLKLLHVLAESSEAMTTAQLARGLEIAPTTCYRIIQTMVGHDWLRPTSTGAFTFSSGMFPLLKPLSDYQQLFESLGAPLRQLVEQTGLTAKISVKQGDVAATVYRIESPRPLSPSFKLGGTFPLALGSSGACLLSGLEDEEVKLILDESPEGAWAYQTRADVLARVCSVRKSGVCYDPGQYQPAVHAISAPIDNREHRCFAAISLIGWANDFSEKSIKELKRLVARCASQCSKKLGDKAVA